MCATENIVFLLGAGRSGTTLLYKVLAAHPDIGYLSNYQNRWPAWMATAFLHRLLNYFPETKRRAWFKKGGGAYFNEGRKWLHSIVPTPAEAESVYSLCGLPPTPAPDDVPNAELIACLRRKFARIRTLGGTRLLLAKRTANNRRIPQLARIFPNARYIHLVRDGRAVAYSLPRVAWWDDHVLYWSGKTPRQMVAEGADPLVLGATNWVEEMKSLEAGLPLISPSRLLEIRYEKLLEDPLEEVRRMIEFVGLGMNLSDDYRALVESLQLQPRAEAWGHSWTEEEKRRVADIQQETLRHWGYAS